MGVDAIVTTLLILGALVVLTLTLWLSGAVMTRYRKRPWWRPSRAERYEEWGPKRWH